MAPLQALPQPDRQATATATATTTTTTAPRLPPSAGLQRPAPRELPTPVDTDVEPVSYLGPPTPVAGYLASVLNPAQTEPAPPAYSASAPFEGRLSARPGSPEFGPDLGAQLKLFVREGISHARLRLHPEEMGPLTVEIRLDGSNAQIHLAAQNEATRQALEQAVPSLAGALRESGLTLTGGGVSEQPRQAQPSGADTAQGGRGNRGQDNDSGNRNTANNTVNNGRDSPNTALNADLNSLRNSPGWVGRRSVVDLVA